ncbi:DUF6210 family protein [Massilia sp. W12]|uniref:DUF6210 family protein n=1 Tax=Massilia sp. W12 TaxID=3126507 RepID=UPI0030CC0081
MKICLYNLEQVGIIILDDRGLLYFNQAGGTACLQPSAKGYFVPISNGPPLDQPELALDVKLTEVTQDLVGLNPAVAQEINLLLMEVSSSDRYEVDLSKLALSSEAWVYVRVYPQGNYSTYGASEPFEAILTWPNSD